MYKGIQLRQVAGNDMTTDGDIDLNARIKFYAKGVVIHDPSWRQSAAIRREETSGTEERILAWHLSYQGPDKLIGGISCATQGEFPQPQESDRKENYCKEYPSNK